jgi:hypothetical protein
MKNCRFWQPPLRSIFAEDLAAETENYNLLRWRSSERNIAELPPLMQGHLRSCGYTDKESVICCRMLWKNTFLKFKPKGKWMPTDFLQVNFVSEPARLVLMNTRLWGLFSFAARDKFQKGKGSMLIRLLGRLTLSDDHGKKMDQAELVTILAETMILPVYALQTYTHWETVNETTVKGTISHGGLTAAGLFHFNEQGRLGSFETEDRYYEVNGRLQACRWTAEASGYISRGDLLLPSSYKATWHLPGGAYEYFRGELSGLEFNSTVLSDSLATAAKGKEEYSAHTEPEQHPVQLVQQRQPDIDRGSAMQQATDTKNGLEDQQHQRVAS